MSWVRKIPWRRKWQPIPICLLRQSHGQRSLAGYRLQSMGSQSLTQLSTHIHYHLYCITLYVLFFMNYYFLLLLISISTFLFKVGHSLVLCIYLIHIYLTVVDTYLFDCGGSQLWHTGFLIAASKLSVVACEIQFPDQGTISGPLH